MLLRAPHRRYLGTDPLQRKASYGTVMPCVHVRQPLTDNSNLRLALTCTMTRPDYYDTVPYRSQNDNDFTVAMGNADLHPTTSWCRLFSCPATASFTCIGVKGNQAARTITRGRWCRSPVGRTAPMALK
jgi:hypothetical protein